LAVADFSRFFQGSAVPKTEPAEIGLACFAVRVNQNQLQLYLPDTTSTEINEGGQHER